MGTFEEPLTLPKFAGARLAVSSVVVSNQMQGAAASSGGRKRELANPLDTSGGKVLPSVTRVFRTDQNLYTYLESYAPKGDGKSASAASGPGAAVAPSVALVFFRGGAKMSEAGPFPGELVKQSSGTARYLVNIPLRKFPAGRYWMQVNVLDPAQDQAAFSRVPLAIMRSSQSGTASAATGSR
jgi:hypothetical protein